MDRPGMPDDFYRKVEQRRKELAERATGDRQDFALSRSGTRYPRPAHPSGTTSSLSVGLVTLLGVLALVACVASATAVVVGGNWLRGALNSPASTTQDFYSALQQSDYASAYTYFSSVAKGHLSESAFADQFGGYDQLDGPVAQISTDAPHYSGNGNVALLSVHVTRSRGGRLQIHKVMLVKEQGNWRIDSITIQFGAGPTPTAQH